ncbi:MAG: Gfo/Idh/MocA family oxidoreductase [Bacteroidota bacterium]
MEKNSRTWRWGILGCGDVTEVKSGPAYQNTKGFEVVAVMRRDAVKAADYAKRHGIPKYYANADALIKDPEVDAVYIATPPDSHRTYALEVARAGKPCCIEKPMAPNYQESLEIFTAFEERGIPLFVAYYRRSLPRFLQIEKWLKEEAIGTVRHLRWHLAKPASEEDRSGEYNWRTDDHIAPGGYFDDLASHGLDLFSFLFGPITQAQGIALNQQRLYSAKDAVTASWLHDQGVVGEGSWIFGGFTHEDTVEITGDKGRITFSIFHDNPLLLENGLEKQALNIDHPEHIQQYHVENIKKHLDGLGTHPSTGSTGLHTSWVMDRILGVAEI